MGKNLAKYFQVTGYLITAMVVIVGLFWGWRHWRQLQPFLYQRPGGWTDTEVTEVDLDVHVGWLVEEEIEDERPENGEKLSEKQRVSLVGAGRAVLLDGKTVLTVAHNLQEQEKYAFYNENLGWQELGEWQIDAAHDLAQANLQESQVVTSLKLAEVIIPDEPVYMWYELAKGGKINGNVVQPQRTIQLQRAWGEVADEDLEVVGVAMDNNLGDSGAGVFNVRGELIGLVVAVDLHDTALSYVVRATAAVFE